MSIGLGLMLLALHLMGESMAPVESSPGLRQGLALVAQLPLPNLLLAAVIAWAAHSSVAAILFVASLGASGVIGAEQAVVMVLGANLGSALNPVLEAGGDARDPARLRVPLGNLLNRAVFGLAALAALPWVTAWLVLLDPAPARLVANAHLLFNLAAALLAFPLLPGLARLLRRALPDRVADADEGAPRYLDAAALRSPPVALANAAREVLRMADGLEAMLKGSAEAFRDGADRDGAKAMGRLDDVVDRLHHAVHGYLARIPREALGDDELRRLAEVQAFAIALEHAADVVDRDLVHHAGKRVRRGMPLAPEEAAALAALHADLLQQLRLAVAVFMLEDLEAARTLVRGKEALREAERAAVLRLTTAGPDAGAPGLMLDAVRDLRRVGAHLAAVAHPLLERHGELLPSRLAGEGGPADPPDQSAIHFGGSRSGPDFRD
jgi:phosphate:Na+ symporter